MQASAPLPDHRPAADEHRPGFPHRAGQKIRAWRKAQEPRLNAEEFGQRYGVSMPQVYRFEAGTAMAPVALALRLERDGVCAVTDWALPVENAAGTES